MGKFGSKTKIVKNGKRDGNFEGTSFPKGATPRSYETNPANGKDSSLRGTEQPYGYGK